MLFQVALGTAEPIFSRSAAFALCLSSSAGDVSTAANISGRLSFIQPSSTRYLFSFIHITRSRAWSTSALNGLVSTRSMSIKTQLFGSGLASTCLDLSPALPAFTRSTSPDGFICVPVMRILLPLASLDPADDDQIVFAVLLHDKDKLAGLDSSLAKHACESKLALKLYIYLAGMGVSQCWPGECQVFQKMPAYQ